MNGDFFNEMKNGATLRPEYQVVVDWIERNGIDALQSRRAEAEALFRRIGITFAVYGEGGDPDRLIPFDMVPRIFNATEWQKIESGSIQRANALNAFIADAYGAREIVKADIVPEAMITKNPAYLELMNGYRPPLDVWAHIIGVDLVRTGPDEFFVLEDNCRTPSGVSYVLQNREVMSRMFPELFRDGRIRPVDGYTDFLAEAMQAVAPPNCTGTPTMAILTPGQFNSAYFEHSFLADMMGIELVEGPDIVVENQKVYMRTTRGFEQLHVIYRRIDDAFLDPAVFQKDSMIGVAGLMDAMKAGNVTVINMPGTGVVDDKAVYTYVPDMIRFYLGEEPIIPNVETYRCDQADDLAYVLDNLSDLVVKEVQGSGGYGMLIGPTSTKDEIKEFALKVKANPNNYIAQPTLSLSSAPVLAEDGLIPRHVDLRPFVVSGATTKMVPSGLSRVALREGSLVVNSSQGGGVKDTWVLNAGAV
ncbi:circularly permuted type 2 ATP-grasp protein [Octadecabacter sp. CECT 8868]|uniref:circularly permuted type 2 ATP-grasp protein n=1 Tax=Octadecabacter algicola TaxID=2909342 RepID=UPI001F343F29|nr:circularly permuted type 2 ATP-grasp protein [Octadecabacter algicola]MCF2904943.1 circularly permuted type 2 ATP-grasp protein [Octadecabacter algicola]